MQNTPNFTILQSELALEAGCESSEFHLTLSRPNRTHRFQLEICQKKQDNLKKRESGMVLKSVSLYPKAVMLTPMNWFYYHRSICDSRDVLQFGNVLLCPTVELNKAVYSLVASPSKANLSPLSLPYVKKLRGNDDKSDHSFGRSVKSRSSVAIHGE